MIFSPLIMSLQVNLSNRFCTAHRGGKASLAKSAKFRKKWFKPIQSSICFSHAKYFLQFKRNLCGMVESYRLELRTALILGLLLWYQLWWIYHTSRLKRSFLGLFSSAGRYNSQATDTPISLQDAGGDSDKVYFIMTMPKWWHSEILLWSSVCHHR